METDPEHSIVSEASQYSGEQRSHFMLWPNTQDPELEKQQRCKVFKTSAVVRFPLIAKIRPPAPLSSNIDHLQGRPTPVILTYASMLGAAAVMLPAPVLVYISSGTRLWWRHEQEAGAILFLSSILHLQKTIKICVLLWAQNQNNLRECFLIIRNDDRS